MAPCAVIHTFAHGELRRQQLGGMGGKLWNCRNAVCTVPVEQGNETSVHVGRRCSCGCASPLKSAIDVHGGATGPTPSSSTALQASEVFCTLLIPLLLTLWCSRSGLGKTALVDVSCGRRTSRP